SVAQSLCGIALDISAEIVYTNDKESTPVDGLLPLLRLKRNNCHRFGR
ncbi:hypothetical protein RUMCAL_00611, partial [Ruminococcus callidus ATCC 27760]